MCIYKLWAFMAEASPSASSQGGSEDLASDPEGLTLSSSGTGHREPWSWSPGAGWGRALAAPLKLQRRHGKGWVLWGHLS